MHDLKIMHCDIKPCNILVGLDGHLAIADFGLSYVPKNDRHLLKYCKRWDIVGTAAYMAPEVLNCTMSSGYKSTADVWSLGVVLYEMGSGLRDPYFHCTDAQEQQYRIHNEELNYDVIDSTNPVFGDLVRKVCRLYARS